MVNNLLPQFQLIPVSRFQDFIEIAFLPLLALAPSIISISSEMQSGAD